MSNHGHRTTTFRIAVRAALPLVAALAAAGAVQADEGEWNLQLEMIFMEAYGHDQHVLNVHRNDFDPTPQTTDTTAITLDTDLSPAYRAEFRYRRGKWGAGIDFLWFLTAQDVGPLTAAADGPSGPTDEVVFEIADDSFSSTDPSEVLYYDILEDTDLAMWMLDVYGMRTLADKPETRIDLVFGFKLGDFDNDYRAVTGIQGIGGTRLDASSNYDRMNGPLVGLAAQFSHGKNEVKGYLGQSVLVGTVELTGMQRQFTGPASAPAFFSQQVLHTTEDVAIPVSELRLKWTYRVSKNVALGAGAHGSVWFDVPVPPGVIPTVGGSGVLHENTIVFFGLLGAVELSF